MGIASGCFFVVVAVILGIVVAVRKEKKKASLFKGDGEVHHKWLASRQVICEGVKTGEKREEEGKAGV